MINQDNYKDELKGICVFEISGESCANCLSLMPIVNKLTSNRDDCRVIHIEADENTTWLMEKFEVDRVPTLLLVDDGEVFARATGFQPEEILEMWLDAKLEAHKKDKTK